MQTLNAAPRDNLTVAQVTSLLTGPSLSVSAGLELLTRSLRLVEDISDDLVGGRVERQMRATGSHGTCSLGLSRALTWGVDLVRPYMVLTNGAVTARFNVGVFSLTTPERRTSEMPATYDVQGFDRLYLLNRPVGDTYTVAAGTSYLTAVTSAITAAGLSGVYLDSSASASTLPTAKVWPLVQAQSGSDGRRDKDNSNITWLAVVNELLADIGYRSLWADENGLFRSEPAALPAARAPEFTFSADDVNVTILGEQRTFLQDVWNVPNRWVFVQQNRVTGAAAPTEGDGVYTVNNTADGITSQSARGLVWAKVISLDAANQAALVTQGNVIVAADRRVAAVYKVTTGPFPAAGHLDVFTYADTALGGSVKVQAVSWQLPLDGGDMTWEWEGAA